MAQTTFESLDEVRAAVGTHARHERLDRGHPGARRPVRRRHRRPPVDPRRRRAGRRARARSAGRSPTATSRCRSPTCSCPQVLEVRGVSIGRQLRHRQGALPRPGARRQPRAGHGAELTAVRRHRRRRPDDDRHHDRDRGRDQARLRGRVAQPLAGLTSPSPPPRRRAPARARPRRRRPRRRARRRRPSAEAAGGREGSPSGASGRLQEAADDEHQCGRRHGIGDEAGAERERRSRRTSRAGRRTPRPPPTWPR